MTKLFSEVDFADTRLRALNGTNPAGKRPHDLADADSVRPFHGRRIPANDNAEAGDDTQSRAA